MHVHVRHGERVAKFWMVPEICLADSYRMTPSELTELERVVFQNRTIIERSWHEFFDE